MASTTSCSSSLDSWPLAAAAPSCMPASNLAADSGLLLLTPFPSVLLAARVLTRRGDALLMLAAPLLEERREPCAVPRLPASCRCLRLRLAGAVCCCSPCSPRSASSARGLQRASRWCSAQFASPSKRCGHSSAESGSRKDRPSHLCWQTKFDDHEPARSLSFSKGIPHLGRPDVSASLAPRERRAASSAPRLLSRSLSALLSVSSETSSQLGVCVAVRSSKLTAATFLCCCWLAA